MRRNDIIVIVALALLFVAWPFIDRMFIAQFFPPPPESAPLETPLDESVPTAERDFEAQSPQADSGSAPVIASPATGEKRGPAAEDLEPARLVELENEDLRIKLSTHGGALVSAVLKNYPLTADEDSPPLELGFADEPALAYINVPSFGADRSFELVESTPESVIFRHRAENGLVLERSYTLEGGHLIALRDVWTAADGQPVALASPGIQMGWMESLPGISEMRGMIFLGVDSLSSGGGGVKYWSKEMHKFFKQQAAAADTRRLPMEIDVDPWDGARGMDWMAVKNKYFVQILTPDAMVQRGIVRARRLPTMSESPESSLKDGKFEPARVGAAMFFEDYTVAPDEALVWNYSCYIGPKKLSALKDLADHKAEVMQLGWLSSIGRLLLNMLNGIHSVIPNYGLAIIILTFIIKLVFWPVTHKGMQGMRRMQELQPEMNAVKEKYKDDKQKQQQAMAELWKKHKINPVGGCLPLIVQIPVFIALFTVLRSAIELRFQEFLWIKDLSEPEHLFNLGFSLPFLGEYFNLLPVLMAVTMWLQQKMTPSTGDAQQQKMMAVFMPIMIFVMLYNFPSGLILYWTTNQIATIVGQAVSRRRHAGDKSPA